MCLPQEVIYREKETLDEILLFEHGNYDLGYEINKKVYYKLRFKKRTGIGAYYVSFNKPTMYNCRAHNICKGYSIKKGPWNQCLSMFIKIGKAMKRKILIDYQNDIYTFMKVQKNRDLARRIGKDEAKNHKDYNDVVTQEFY